MAATTHVPPVVNSGSCKLWNPLKELYATINDAILRKLPEAQADLEQTLRRFRPNFAALLDGLPKNSAYRKIIAKASSDGIQFAGQSGKQKLDEAFIAESFIISDLFNISEYDAVELLLAGEQQMCHHSGLTRGLVAVMLYHDGRRCLVAALRTLVQARQGRCFSAGLPTEIQMLVTEYTDQLKENGIITKILAHINSFNVPEMIKNMTEQRALGKPKHRFQVKQLMDETRLGLAECLFYWSCQTPFPRQETSQLLTWLKNADCDGSMDSVTLAVLMSFMYSVDASSLEMVEDLDDSVESLPMISDSAYIPAVHNLVKSDAGWKCAGLHAVVQLTWALTLRLVSQHPLTLDSATSACEEDEDIVDAALQKNVFFFLSNSVLKSPSFVPEEEFYLRAMHNLISTFIVQMPFKVKELRNMNDDGAHVILNHQKHGIESPSNVRKDFQHLLQLIGDLYAVERNSHCLAEEFWCTQRPPTPRQISLHKFLRLAGDLVPPPLFVSYIDMLTGLSSSEIGAVNCFSLLKANGEQASMVSWDHIFSSLNQYFTNLRQEAASKDAPISRGHGTRDITQQELSGLSAVCGLIKEVASQSMEARYALSESQQWLTSVVMFGLVGCSIPAKLKADILLALAALAKSPEVASNLWQMLELSQLLTTVKTDDKKRSGIITELEEVESRMEEYPMCRAFLTLLENLCAATNQPPETLGLGYRNPGFQPYLEFVVNDVLLKFASRGYKDIAEKWQVAEGSLAVLYQILSNHQIEAEQFQDNRVELSPGKFVPSVKLPGHVLLTLLLQSSPLLKTILAILHDGLEKLSLYQLTKERRRVESCTLVCLKLLSLALDMQELFLDQLRLSGQATIVSRLDKLLMGINARSGRADHLINITRYSMYAGMLPYHAMYAVKVMASTCAVSTIRPELVSLFTADRDVSQEILTGLVECIELAADFTEDMEVRCETARAVLHLLLVTIKQTTPNLAHFLLGFNANKPIHTTDLQCPGVLGFSRTCLHAVLLLVDSEATPSHLAELSHKLIYLLCSNPDTSGPVLRYLRTTHDFFFKHLLKLPFSVEKNGDELEKLHALKKQTWFLKALAVELRVTSLNKQRSHTQRLISSLLDSNMIATSSNATGILDLELSTLEQSSFNVTSLAQLNAQKGAQQRRRRLLQFLDSVSFNDVSLAELGVDQFNAASVMQVLSNCEERSPDSGLISVNIKNLHHVLMSEVNAAQGNTGAVHRDALLVEVREILRYAVEWNAVRENVHTRVQAYEAWRQVAEVILTGCPEEAVGKQRQIVIFDLLNEIFKKCLQDGALDDLVSSACGTILTLMASLRHTMLTDPTNASTPAVFTSSLQVVLRGILNLVVTTSGALQRARANLYGALLYHLQLSERSANKNTDPLQDNGVGSAVMGRETDVEKLARESLSTIHSFGDSLLDVICRDACDGVNISRILALSCLDSIVALDSHQTDVLTFMSVHGYLRHLIDGLVLSDQALLNCLDPAEPMRQLYIYENTMSVLTRLAMTARGAGSLLHAGLMGKLAECTVYDARPNSNYTKSSALSMEFEGFLPSMISRYRQVLFPCLRLCLSVLVSLGSENELASSQVMKFIVSHGDTFYNVLRDQPDDDVDSLEELSLLTAVLSSSAAADVLDTENDAAGMTAKSQISRIQRRLMSLLSKFLLLDDWWKRLKMTDHLSDSLKQQMMTHVHDIAANISCYCRNVIANSSTDVKFCRILFGPSLIEAMSREAALAGHSYDFSQSLSNTQPPNLGLIVVQLNQAARRMLEALNEHKQMKTRLEGGAEMLTEEITQLEESDSVLNMTGLDRQADAKKIFKARLAQKTHMIHTLFTIVENCLYVLWRHLDFYFLHCIPQDMETSLFRSHSRNQSTMRKLTERVSSPADAGDDTSSHMISAGISREQLAALKEMTPKCINESFFHNLAEIESCYASKRTHYDYTGALCRRLRRLVNLHCDS